MEENLLRIGEIAAFYNVSAKAMRLYEKMGIIKPVKIDDTTKYRYYSADQVQQLEALLELKELGFSLAEIKKLLEGGMSNDAFMEALVHKKAKWQDAISVAENKIGAIDKLTARLAMSEPAVKMHKLTEDERARLLGRLACVEDLHGRSVLSEALWL
ncbi:MAG: MerR family transcriptional regulator [Clostridiales bacterium]|jgi:DNA-binding transcriptional MerR regulator|nr:MerR family transcriptional regulator [Clostridiales bacterium]